MHDIGKPACTRRDEDGSITSRGHSARGANLARHILWRLATPFAEREQLVAMIRWHESPFFVIDDSDCQRRVYGISQRARCDLLAIAATADGRGRECADPADQRRILDNVELFIEYCRDHDCLSGPRAFPSRLSRFLYFRKTGRDPDYEAYDDCRFDAVLMSGLPAAGKDHWIREHCPELPVVSLDEIRSELKIDPDGPQGKVVNEGRERARTHLRAQRSFVWNATNLRRDHRERLVSLFTSYGARVRIVYLEVPEPVLRRRNRERESPVPERVLKRMIDNWSVPEVVEAPRVEWQLSSGE
jgi:predicted kinase